MRDATFLAKMGLPVVALITERFWDYGRNLAIAFGVPDLPRLELPFPVAGIGASGMRVLADAIVPRLFEMLAGGDGT